MRQSVRAREVRKGEPHSHPLHGRHLIMNIYVLFKCVWLSLHVHLDRE